MRTPMKGRIRIRAAAILLATLSLAVLASIPAQAAAKKTYFTGEETSLSQVPGTMLTDGQNTYFLGRELVAREDITDPRLNGTGHFCYTIEANLATWTATYWGTSRIVPDIGGGEWNGHWVASMTPEGTTIQMTAVGSDDYEGLVARLTYTSGPEKLQIAGYIVEAKGGPGDRPFKVKACRTERMESLPCTVLDPLTWEPVDPAEFKTIVRLDVLSEVGQATHAGRISNDGLALLDPESGAATGRGMATAANGDELFWVYSGSLDSETGVAQGSVDFCGGTGRFDAAVGGFDLEDLEINPEETDEEGVFMSDYCYSGSGTIRY